MNFDRNEETPKETGLDSTPPTSIFDELNNTDPNESQPFYKKKAFLIAMGILSFLLVISVVFMIMTAGGKEEVRQQAVTKPDPEIQKLQEEAAQERAAQAIPEIDPAIAALPSDDFVFSETPVFTLADQSVKDIIRDIPSLIDDGQRIIAPDGSFIYKNDPVFLQGLDETRNLIESEIKERRLLEKKTNSVSGETDWYIRSGEGFTDEDFVPIESPQEATILRNQLREFAKQTIDNKLHQANWQSANPQPQGQQAPVATVDPALSEAERERLLKMVETQRNNNLELVRQNKELREEMIDIKKKVVDMVQRLEDSPNVNARLRATMIPESTGWKVTAVMGDRVYLINKKTKETVTLSQGDKIPSSQLIISHADENTGIVLVTPSE